MSEQDDERLSRAAMRSLKAAAPADLKAELKRRARARRPAPSLWDGLRGLLGEGGWVYGAGAAFAAAGLLVAVLRLAPAAPRGVPEASGPRVTETPSAAALADLWADDDGGDHD